jgi:glutamyl-tRNA reductase
MESRKYINAFFVAGINYKKSDTRIRSRFAINSDQYERIISIAPSLGVHEFFVISTCNRTEIYGFAENARVLYGLLCSQTEGSISEFREIAYVKQGAQAINHLFNVAAGLDSQILGDYEIIGQIKQSAKFSKQHGCIGVYLERMVNEVLKASKNIRTNTTLSSGTVSVSFAAIQFIKSSFQDVSGKRILLIGTGKIGTNACKNLVDYLPGTLVTLINRTTEKSKALAGIYNLQYDEIGNLQSCINNADVILVATSAKKAIITSKHLQNTGSKLIIDFSVPCNVSPRVKKLSNIKLINVDELSSIKDKTLESRSAEIPKVKMIIREHVDEFLEWHEMRQHVPVLKAVKNKLFAILSEGRNNSIPMLCDSSKKVFTEERIQKVINGMAVKMRTQHQPGCQYIEAINDFISTASS